MHFQQSLSIVLVSLATLAGSATAEEPAQPLPAGQIEILVEDLHCNTCAKKGARKIYALKGVKKVSWNLAEDRLTVLTPPTDQVAPLRFWDAAIAGGLKPTTLRHGEIRLEAEEIEQLRQQASLPGAARR